MRRLKGLTWAAPRLQGVRRCGLMGSEGGDAFQGTGVAEWPESPEWAEAAAEVEGLEGAEAAGGDGNAWGDGADGAEWIRRSRWRTCAHDESTRLAGGTAPGPWGSGQARPASTRKAQAARCVTRWPLRSGCIVAPGIVRRSGQSMPLASSRAALVSRLARFGTGRAGRGLCASLSAGTLRTSQLSRISRISWIYSQASFVPSRTILSKERPHADGT